MPQSPFLLFDFPLCAVPLRMEKILLHQIKQPFSVQIPLVSSKSESNRALIINALSQASPENLQNLSTARDTQTMMRLLDSDNLTADVLDAGTTMRFLTAYFALTGREKIMIGTPRMCERPIGILVNALRQLGAKIECLKKEGFPPLHLREFKYSGRRDLQIRGDVSSQFISALLMLAPTLPEGLRLYLTGDVGSVPYIQMTLELMAHFGIKYEADWQKNIIDVPAQDYVAKPFMVESDWSGASYWYAFVALSPFENTELEVLGLKAESLQGDSVLVELMSHLGVKSVFDEKGVKLTKIPTKQSLTWDFANCPDIAQTIAVICTAKQISLTLTGIESLKVKETDRILALQNELAKIGGQLVEVEKNTSYLLTSNFNPQKTTIHTYDDHRMAMAFAPLACVMDIEIDDPSVVNKSYPSFWEDVKRITEIS
jgi:3-phosphoshikimate 1-carboxyvinyltransferase